MAARRSAPTTAPDPNQLLTEEQFADLSGSVLKPSDGGARRDRTQTPTHLFPVDSLPPVRRRMPGWAQTA